MIHFQKLGPRRGFTIVELLVVITVITLLLSLLLPAMSQARAMARSTTCSSNMRQIGVAAGIYSCADFPDWVFVNVNGGMTNGVMWQDIIMDYIYGSDPNADPTMTTLGDMKVMRCPGSIFQSNGTVGYGIMFQGCYNYQTDKLGYYQNNWNDWNNAWPIRPNTGWKDPLISMYVADAYINDQPIAITTTYPTQESPGTIDPSQQLHTGGLGTNRWLTTGAWTRGFADRHLGSNVLLLDWSVHHYKTIDLDMMQPGGVNTIWDTAGGP